MPIEEMPISPRKIKFAGLALLDLFRPLRWEYTSFKETQPQHRYQAIIPPLFLASGPGIKSFTKQTPSPHSPTPQKTHNRSNSMRCMRTGYQKDSKRRDLIRLYSFSSPPPFRPITVLRPHISRIRTSKLQNHSAPPRPLAPGLETWGWVSWPWGPRGRVFGLFSTLHIHIHRCMHAYMPNKQSERKRAD